MHITELRIAGFKSFVDPETVPIEQGLTGIVGPNGCGKSNLLEALRWAMGATSARAMRGGEMDDLIFNGAAGRPARELAEVTLVLDNRARRAPAEFNQADSLEIVRRLKRGSGSTYKLNGRTVRAKDVQLIFADASTGANSPSLVRQGQINELIASKPQNRRRILEEAAGVAGLSARRHEAELKLQAAENNLTNLSDLTQEIERQLESLKRQARKARKYKELSEELSALEAFVLHLKWQSALEVLNGATSALEDARRDVGAQTRTAALAETKHLEMDAALSPLRSAESEAAARVGQLRIELARQETERDGAEEKLTTLREDCERLSEEISDQSQQLDEARVQVSDAQSRLDLLPDIESELDSEKTERAKEALRAARQFLHDAQAAADDAALAVANFNAEKQANRAQLSSLHSRRDRLSQEIELHKAELSALEQKQVAINLDAAIAAEAEAKSQSEQNKQTLDHAEAHHAELKLREQERLAPVEDARKALNALNAEITGLERLLKTETRTHSNPVIEHVSIHSGYEKAVGAVLGDDLTASTDASSDLYWAGAHPPAQPLPEGCEPLSRFATAPPELRARLSQCGICSIETGPSLARSLKPGQRLVTREGHLWRWDGFTKTPNAPSSAAERLEQKARLEANQRQAIELDRVLENAQAAWQSAQREIGMAEQNLNAARSAANLASDLAQSEHNRLIKLKAEFESIASRKETHAAQLQRLEGEWVQLNALIATTSSADNHQSAGELEVSAEAAKTQLDAARNAEIEARGVLADLTRNREQALARRKSVEEDLTRWQGLFSKIELRLAQLKSQLDARQSNLQQAEALPETLNARCKELVDRLETAESERKRATDQLASHETALRTVEQELRESTNLAMKARERLVEQKARQEASQAIIADLNTRAAAQFNVQLDGLIHIAADTNQSEEQDGLSQEEAERRLTEIRFERERLGGVNMESETEAELLQTRLNTQELEQADLSAAIEKLRQGIQELNGEARQRLVNAYESVNTHFKSLFKTLFRGGEAELRLVDAEDPLDAGLEIFAQPPGKRLGTLSLMSGGEQALTAAALIFAVFLSRPAPICVLDEVDAPLDDANVDRFCRMLNEMRQRTDTRFVVITHNPVTMSRMDRLFGVTMREQGVSKLVSVDLNAAEALVAAE